MKPGGNGSLSRFVNRQMLLSLRDTISDRMRFLSISLGVIAITWPPSAQFESRREAQLGSYNPTELGANNYVALFSLSAFSMDFPNPLGDLE